MGWTKQSFPLLLIIVGFGAGVMARITEPATAGNEPPTLTVCEALTRASDYDGKIVRVRDRVSGTDEWSAFLTESCPGVLKVDGKTFPSSIVWTMPSDELIIHATNFDYDWDSDKRLGGKWKALSKTAPSRCTLWTYTGMFEVWSKPKARKPVPGGWKEFDGFGHLNGWGAQLVLKSADDVQAIPNCK